MKHLPLLLLVGTAPMSVHADAPDYNRDIAPLLRKYCQGCHNAEEANGELRLDSFEQLTKGGEHGPAIIPGGGKVSRLVRVMTGEAEPAMPPEDEKQPTADEIALVAKWIDAGAAGPSGDSPAVDLITPDIKPAAEMASPIQSLAWSPDGKTLAVAKGRVVELRDAAGKDVTATLPEHSGKVNDLTWSLDGKLLLTASGVEGLRGEVVVWDVAGRKRLDLPPLTHGDMVYAVAISHDGKIIASGSYDRTVKLWDAATGRLLRTLTQHNGPIYDLAFSPDGNLLGSASGDETVKIWHVASGRRLDTLGQPEGEQYAVLFSPDGRFVVAGGADNRIRVWQVVVKDKPRINPLLFARFAHEGAITALAWRSQEHGIDTLISAADDKTLKAWETREFRETKLFDAQSDVVSSLAAHAEQQQFAVARLDGSLALLPYPVAKAVPTNTSVTSQSPAKPPEPIELKRVAETEPNNQPDQASVLPLPGTASGVISASEGGHRDADLFRFTAKAGQPLIVETKGERMKSPIDTKIEILDAAGKPVPQVQLQAVRDSYFTFRGKNSSQTNDFRVHNWQEMTLNQYLYASGEVVKLHTYPRGPDSGFDVYPKRGQRWNYFGTTAVSHALGEPCYIVEAHPPEATLIPNGLPVFTIGYENDDDSDQKLGSDSRLTFIPPADGEYLVRVTDTRGFGGDSYKYELTIRPPRPDFNVRLDGGNPTVNRGSGKMFTLVADRIDGYTGPIRVEVTGVPEGYYVTSPLVIEENHITAQGAVYADAEAKELTADDWKAVKVTATAMINRREVSKPAGSLGHVKVAEKPKVLLSLSPKGAQPSPPGEIPEITIRPGQTLATTLRVERNGNNGVLSFGKEDAGRNLPHGVYVDNIGLNGVLLLPGQNERSVFITADTWVPKSSRLFFLRSDQEGGQCSWPVRIRVE